jgi:hypothetical protein
LQGGLQVIEAHLQAPATQVSAQDLVGGVQLFIEEGGDHLHLHDPEAF